MQLEVAQCEDDRNIENGVVRETHAYDKQKAFHLRPANLNQRRANDLVLGLNSFEHRRLPNSNANPESDQKNDRTHEEWNAPTPGHKLRLGQLLGHPENADGGSQTDSHSDLRPASIETTSISRRELDGQNRGASEFGSGAKALDQAKHKKQDR